MRENVLVKNQTCVSVLRSTYQCVERTEKHTATHVGLIVRVLISHATANVHVDYRTIVFVPGSTDPFVVQTEGHMEIDVVPDVQE